MITPGKVAKVLKQRGVSGTVAAGCRKVAAKLDPKFSAGIAKEEQGQLEENWNEYLSWVTFAVAGMLTRGNVFAIDHALRNLPKTEGAMVEIGSFCGLSTCVMGYFREKYVVTNPFFTADRWEFEGQDQGAPLGDSKTVTHLDYRTFVRDSFLRNLRTFCPNDLPHTIELFSDDFFKAWTAGETKRDVFEREVVMGGPIVFSYIDGNHTYEFAKRDFENTDKYLVPGGFVFLDDFRGRKRLGSMPCRRGDQGGQEIYAHQPQSQLYVSEDDLT